MRPSTSILPCATLLMLLGLVAGCASENPPSAPDPAAAIQPVEPGIPIEVREDADAVGMLDPITLHAASREGRNLNVTVSYRGSETHAVRALASTCYRASYPGQIYVYLQHDAAGDVSDGVVEQEIAYDIEPILEYFETSGWKLEPFYIRVVTPAARDLASNGSRLVMIEP